MTACKHDFDMPFSCDNPLNVSVHTLLIVIECRIMFVLKEHAVFDVASWLTRSHLCWKWFSCRMIGFRFRLDSLSSDSCYKGKSSPVKKAINFTRLSVYWSVFGRLLDVLDNYIYQNKWGVTKSEVLLLVVIFFYKMIKVMFFSLGDLLHFILCFFFVVPKENEGKCTKRYSEHRCVYVWKPWSDMNLK